MKPFLPRKLAGLTILALAASVASCNHDKLTSEAPQPTTATVDKELDAVAKAFAHSLGASNEARQLLKTEAEKKFDGDFDVLYTAFVAQKPAFGQQVSEALSSDGQALADVVAHVPYLNIAVPVNITKWNTADYAPLVTFVPAGFDEKTYTKPLKAYDKDGQVHWLDTKHAPEQPVVVIGPSERVTNESSAARWASAQQNTHKPKTLKSKGSAPANLYDDPGTQLEPTTDGGGGGGGYTPPSDGTTYGNCRNNMQTEYLTSLWMDDVSEYESWFLGEPEIVLQILVPTGMNTSTGGGTTYQGTFSMSRGSIEDTWYCDLDLYYWNTNTSGDAVQYVWVEQDGGDIATVELNLSYTLAGVTGSTKVTYTIGNDDDMIGTKKMDFHLCTTRGYYSLNGGSREFRWTTESRP